MSRTLAEDIDRGRKAIDLAQQQGQDTSQRERSLADLERQDLLACASKRAEQDLILSSAVAFWEEPHRPIAITEVSSYVVKNLRLIAMASVEQRLGGWHIWTSDWWTEREHLALGSLASLRSAMGTRLSLEDDPAVRDE